MLSRIRFLRVNDAGQRTEDVTLHFSGLPQSYVDSDGEYWIAPQSTRIIEHLARDSNNLEFDSIQHVYQTARHLKKKVESHLVKDDKEPEHVEDRE